MQKFVIEGVSVTVRRTGGSSGWDGHGEVMRGGNIYVTACEASTGETWNWTWDVNSGEDWRRVGASIAPQDFVPPSDAIQAAVGQAVERTGGL